MEWQRGAGLDPLPAACHILRVVPGENSEVIETLVEAIASELTGRAPATEP